MYKSDQKKKGWTNLNHELFFRLTNFGNKFNRVNFRQDKIQPKLGNDILRHKMKEWVLISGWKSFLFFFRYPVFRYPINNRMDDNRLKTANPS